MSHSRSISLPSRPHPSAADVEDHLCRLRSSDATSTSSLCNKLSGLKDLYICVDDLLQLPVMHSSDSEEVLGASIRLLDLCNLTKDAFSQMRASVQDLESSLRRREADVSSKVARHLICMKKINKMVSKSLASFKKSQNKKCKETSAIVSLLKEVEEVSLTIFESLFSSVFPVKETSKQNRWSLVFKSTQSKRVHEVSEQNYLMALDTNMQRCEEDLECLFRSLIKTRVSILNVLNQ
ncbi:DUF241 domain-containing protein [Heracleum sosnowskyi]|uniref:DUF241 domain-containing protein n=1 Tax=Heracleum sosnowskyi TaxID=360622 RepID=A0AAD8GNT5_9APIA|nr:DUF241 domain-containing protein [Heracleum sosnowskyi]KAK1351714.1 DUF241 domain-containing protein [Heracleum sosnowskyi]